MKTIRITHARILSKETPTFGVRLNITVPAKSKENARKIIKEQFQADNVHLTYNEYEPTR